MKQRTFGVGHISTTLRTLISFAISSHLYFFCVLLLLLPRTRSESMNVQGVGNITKSWTGAECCCCCSLPSPPPPSYLASLVLVLLAGEGSVTCIIHCPFHIVLTTVHPTPLQVWEFKRRRSGPCVYRGLFPLLLLHYLTWIARIARAQLVLT